MPSLKPVSLYAKYAGPVAIIIPSSSSGVISAYNTGPPVEQYESFRIGFSVPL